MIISNNSYRTKFINDSHSIPASPLVTDNEFHSPILEMHMHLNTWNFVGQRKAVQKKHKIKCNFLKGSQADSYPIH